jgi:hypothetical protein
MRPDMARDAPLSMHGGLSLELCAVICHVSPMALYRLICALGHQSLVTVLTRCGLPLPIYFLADEKYSHCLTEKVYLPTIASGRVLRLAGGNTRRWWTHRSMVLGHTSISLALTSKDPQAAMLREPPPSLYTRDGDGKGLSNTGQAPENVPTCGGDQQTRHHPERVLSPRANKAPSDQQQGVLTDTYKSSSSTPAAARGRSCNSG